MCSPPPQCPPPETDLLLTAEGSLLFGELPAGATQLTIEHAFCHHPIEIARG